MSTLNIFQQTKPVSGANVLVAAIYDPAAPAVVVASYIFPLPYSAQTQLVSFTDLENIVYKYILYESPDGSATGTPRNNFDIQPSNNSFVVREDLFLEADVSPFIVRDTNFYGPNPSLIGWDWYVEMVTQGTMQPDVDYSKTIDGVITTIDDKNANGWVLLQSGALIDANQKFVIHFYPQLNTISTGGGSAKLINATIQLTANTDLDNSAAGNSYLLSGVSGYFNVNLPDLATMPENKPIYFISAGGSHINVGITGFSGQQYLYGGNVNQIILGRDEQMLIYKFTIGANYYWLVAAISDGVKNVGEIIWSHTLDVPNTILANGDQAVSCANYTRLFNKSKNYAETVSAAAWSATFVFDGVTYYTNKNKYSYTNPNTVFGIPDIGLYGFVRAANGTTRKVGDTNSLLMLRHAHDETIGALSPRPNGYNPTERTVGRYSGTNNSVTDLTGQIFNPAASNTAATTMQRIGDELRPDNVILYALIRC